MHHVDDLTRERSLEDVELALVLPLCSSLGPSLLLLNLEQLVGLDSCLAHLGPVLSDECRLHIRSSDFLFGLKESLLV